VIELMSAQDLKYAQNWGYLSNCEKFEL
jgi:hypothetical protein